MIIDIANFNIIPTDWIKSQMISFTESESSASFSEMDIF